MMNSDDVLDRVRDINPVPDTGTIPDEVILEVTALIETGRRDMAHTSPNADPVRRVSGALWRRPAVAFTAAFMITLAAVGVVAVISASDSGPFIVSGSPAETATTPTTMLSSAAVNAVPIGTVTIDVEGLTGHLGDGLSGLLQRYDPESGVEPSSGILTENIASFAVDVDTDPFSTSQVLRDIDADPDDYAFSEGWRYLGDEAEIPAGIYRLTVWVGPDHCCFLYLSPPEDPAQRCQMWVTVTGKGQTIHVKDLGTNQVHCNPEEPLQPLPSSP